MAYYILTGAPKAVPLGSKEEDMAKELNTTKNRYKMYTLISTGLSHWSDKFQGFGMKRGNARVIWRPTGSDFEGKVKKIFGKR